MPFTVQELENVANATIDFHERNKVHKQSLQDKPLLKMLNAAGKSFPGGKEFITGRAKGDYTTTIQGFEHDDEVEYQNPANLKEFKYGWRLIHGGISFTMHELLKNGISISDSANGKGESTHSEAELIQLTNLLEDKIDDMEEGMERGFNRMYWQDGSQDPKEIAGITSFILNDPTSAVVVGGLDQVALPWWRNRANVGFAQGSTPGDLTVVNLLQKELRQLRRYGGRPNVGLAGSDFLEWMEKELRSKGTFVQEGWAKKGSIDMSTADISFKGIEFEYDPTLDDLGKSKYLYLLDSKSIQRRPMDGEDMKKHNPARPENKYVFYRAKTYVGGLTCNRRNGNGVYSIT